MVDMLQLYCDDIEEVYNLYNSNFITKTSEKRNYNLSSKIVGYTHNYKFKNIVIIFKLDNKHRIRYAHLKGSLHYLFNEGMHNANDFCFEDLTNTIDNLTKRLNIKSNKWLLRPFEYGLNLQVPYNVDEIVFNTFSERKKLFSDIRGHSRKSGSCNNDISLKHYNKHYQFSEYALKNTLRLELKINKTRWLKNVGIKSLKDLYNIEFHKKLINEHLKYLSQVIVFDHKINIDRTNKDFIYTKDYSNINFWRRQIKDGKLKPNSKSYNFHFKRLKRLSEKYGCNLWLNILKLVRIHYNNLLGVEFLCVN